MFDVPGDPPAIRDRAGTARAKGRELVGVADALQRITTDGWTGRAADRFREKFDPEPHRWRQAGDGFVAAGQALDGWAAALERAQATARRAAAEYARGERLTAEAQAAYARYVHRAEENAAAGYTVVLEPFHDPGEAVRGSAVAAMDSARAELDGAAAVCAGALRGACAAAPERRNWLETGLAFAAGVGESVAEMANLVKWVSPLAPLYALQDVLTGRLTIEEFAAQRKMTAEQARSLLESAREDPAGFAANFGKAMVNWDTWADDPARAAGNLVPDAALTIATAGAGGAAVAAERGALSFERFATGADDLVDGARRLDDAGDWRRLSVSTTAYPAAVRCRT
jgi:hypothetical protein